jgi:hypothetical protein
LDKCVYNLSWATRNVGYFEVAVGVAIGVAIGVVIGVVSVVVGVAFDDIDMALPYWLAEKR